MVSDLQDAVRQPLQVIRTQADNIRESLPNLDEHLKGSIAAIDRAVLRIDELLSVSDAPRTGEE